MQMLSSELTAADYDARVDRLLWSNATRAAQSLMPMTSLARRPVLEARLAYETKSADAAAKFSAAGQAALADSGLLLERAAALKAAGNSWGARDLLANRLPLSQPPAVPKEWLKTLLSYAQAAANDGQYDTAYKIASKANDALPASEAMADQDLTTRDHLAGWQHRHASTWPSARCHRNVPPLFNRSENTTNQVQGALLGRHGCQKGWRQRLGTALSQRSSPIL
jgi:soluble lytic murein transglycosylase